MIAAKPVWREIVRTPPHLCVEILSPEDRPSETVEKVREYLAFGVQFIWVIDPVTCNGQIYTPAGVSEIQNRIFATDRFQVDLSAVES